LLFADDEFDAITQDLNELNASFNLFPLLSLNKIIKLEMEMRLIF